jgi:hypothetical protein
MNETVHNLVDAIASGDALGTQNAFADAMAEKLSTRLDDMRQSVAQSMFAQQEEVVEEEFYISEEDYNNLSEEEKTEYEMVNEGDYGKGEYNTDVGKTPKTFHGAVKQYMRNKGNDTPRYDASRAQQATAKKRMVKAKKVIKKAGGDMNKVNQRASDYEDKTNSY